MHKVVGLLVFFFLSGGLMAQNLTELGSPLYRDLERWEVQGLLHQLPLLQPYGGQLVRGYLDQVIERGTEADQRKAQAYYDKLFAPSRVQLELADTEYFGGNEWFGLHTGIIHVQGSVGEAVHLEANIDTVVLQAGLAYSAFKAEPLEQNTLPTGRSFPLDWWLDQTVTRVGDTWLAATPAYSTLISVGSPRAAFQMGTTRTSFGGFLGDSLVLSPQAVQAPQASFTWTTDSTILSFLAMSLTATDWTGKSGAYSGKFLALSTAQWEVFPWMELQVWQTAVYGQRFALEYLMPSIYFLTAEQNGNIDNMFLGGGGTLEFPGDLSLRAKVYLDDFKVMEFIFGSSHTGLKAGMQAELDWQPSALPGFSFQGVYTAVLPYTSTHWPDYLDAQRADNYQRANYAFEALPNYLDYSHSGRNLGFSLGPNSDRLAGQARWDGPAESRFGWGFVVTRHANASEGADVALYPYLAHVLQGTVFDHGLDLNGAGANLYSVAPFLGQAIIETRAQTTVEGTWSIPQWKLDLAASVSAEYAWNRALVAGDNGWRWFATVGLAYRLL